jgi:hypothetical protein
MELVNQPGLDRLCGEVGTADADIAPRRRFHLPDRFRVEVLFDPRFGTRYRLECLRVDDLFGFLPYPREWLMSDRDGYMYRLR